LGSGSRKRRGNREEQDKDLSSHSTILRIQTARLYACKQAHPGASDRALAQRRFVVRSSAASLSSKGKSPLRKRAFANLDLVAQLLASWNTTMILISYPSCPSS
jgi:hypothetical protein